MSIHFFKKGRLTIANYQSEMIQKPNGASVCKINLFVLFLVFGVTTLLIHFLQMELGKLSKSFLKIIIFKSGKFKRTIFFKIYKITHDFVLLDFIEVFPKVY